MTKEEIIGLEPGEKLNYLVATKVMGLQEGIDFGELPEHEWIEDEDGEIDIFAFESHNHNGPRCKKCGYSFCHHCDPDGYTKKPCVVNVPDYSNSQNVTFIMKILDKIGGTVPYGIQCMNNHWLFSYLNGEQIFIAETFVELVCKHALLVKEGLL